MTQLKRVPVKFLRDLIKKNYVKNSKCYICESQENLELHHLYSLSELFYSWCRKNGIFHISTKSEIDHIRPLFIEDNGKFLHPSSTLTLCRKHHLLLHHFYGQSYGNEVVPKIIRWIEIQKEKNVRRSY